ncbi:hypothetical protein ABGB12_03910 [Actinocorallia sp. B10E7]|uniref:hypothetical protein n=1 Tax=Actinocorallia sp. B10E7 TaxID=3153558 RepID=UPI00325D20D3
MTLRRSLPVLTALTCGLGVLPGLPARAAAPPVEAVLTLFADPKAIAAGGEVRLSGTLQGRTEAGDVIPIPGEAIEIDNLNTVEDDGLDALTRTDGSYSVTASLRETGTFRARFEADGQKADSPRVQVRVLATAVLHDFGVSYSPSRRFKATGRLTLSAGPNDDPTRIDVSLQYSPDGRRGWRTVTRTRPDAHRGLRFGPFTHAPGWWRLRFPGDEHYAPATSTVRKAWRWKTSFDALTFTPRRIKVGKKITVSGVLYRTGAKRKGRFPYARQKVAVIFLCGKTWRVAAKGRTDAKGRFKIKAGTWCDARYQVVFDGTAKGDTLRAYSKSAKIDTLGRPTLN